MPNVALKENVMPQRQAVLELYQSVHWSAAAKPDALINALKGCHALVTAWRRHRLVGLGNAISDGHLVVYFPHLVVHPDFQRQGVGLAIVSRLKQLYSGFHQQILVADGTATAFYAKAGFQRAGSCVPMWIYDGKDHG